MFIKPNKQIIDGEEVLLQVRCNITKLPLPAEGREVDLSPYWMRRLNSNEVIEVKKETQNTKGSN